MISNFKLFAYFNISQNFVQNVQKQKNTSVLSWCQRSVKTDLNKVQHDKTLEIKKFQMQHIALSKLRGFFTQKFNFFTSL